MNHIQFLAKVSIFEGVPSRILERLAAACRSRNVSGGQTVFFEGDDGRTMCIIVSGKVSVQRTTATGNTLHVADRGPGEHIGELSLIDGEPRSADVVALEPTELLILNGRDFERAISDSPELALAVMKTLARRLREQSERLSRASGLDALGKLCMLLLELGGANQSVRMSQGAIATRIGVSRETVNRSLTQLVAVNAVELQGRSIVIRDVKLSRGSGQVRSPKLAFFRPELPGSNDANQSAS